MSVYKVIGNYYVEFLDYINDMYRKNNGDLNKFFKTNSILDKREIIDKLAFLMQRTKIIEAAQLKFYNTKKNNYNFFIILIWILISAAAVIIISLLKFQLRDGQIYLFSEKLRTGIIYTLVFLIMFTVFFLLFLNIKINREKIESLIGEAGDDINRLRTLMIKNPPNKPNIYTLLEFIGYKNSGMIGAYNDIYKRNKASIDQYLVMGDQKAQPGQKTVAKAIVQPYHYIDYDKLYNEYGAMIQENVMTFYNNGEGYDTVRKELIASSNSMILKEVRNIMKYYYKITKRKENPESLEMSEQSKLNVIDRYVLADLKLTKFLTDERPTDLYITPPANDPNNTATNLIAENTTANVDFQAQFRKLKLIYAYAVAYCYQLYLRKTTNEADFDTTLKLYMPQLIDLSTVTSDYDVCSYMQKEFTKHFTTLLPATMADIKALPADSNINTFYEKTLIQLKDIFDVYYQSTVLVMKGNYLFPYDATYMSNQLDAFMFDAFKPSETSVTNLGFKPDFMQSIRTIIKDKLVPKCYDTFKLRSNAEYNKGAIVSRIATNVMRFNFRLNDYSQYIVGKLNSSMEMDASLTATVVDVISIVDKTVVQKKLGEISTFGKKANDLRFLTLDEFMSFVDDFQYSDLKSGLNTGFLKEILDRFYFSVSGSSFMKDKNSKDVYFNKEKNFTLARTALILICVILTFGLIYHLIGVSDDIKYSSKAKVEFMKRYSKEEAEKLSPDQKKYIKEMKFGFLDRKVNTYIQAIIPVVAMVFFMCLLYSFYKKAMAKYNFNKETIDTNTFTFRSSVKDINLVFEDLDKRVPFAEWNTPIKNIPAITIEEKTKIYEKVKTIIDKFEKCNYILASQKNDLPFPYTETIVDGFMIVICIMCILYVIGKINPIEKLRDMKVLYSMKERGLYQEGDKEFVNEVVTKANCHDMDIESIVFTLKILFFLFVIMFLIFYSTKVISSTSEFESGMYNSVFFEESMCFE
jgi:hypothetical protein